ncbi:MAG TPA: TetR/AcrR family transcriptional regulator [Acidimicrobiales bacterium]|nr:TetR/AcrR family transcriptional regulator [Acidimicrobiales bacterium]
MGRLSGPRLGRPPASTAGDTRQRIIGVAAELFSDLGYGVTTNKDVAVAAGISTGALYYYFASKLDMYVAVFRELQARVDVRMRQVMETETTFGGRLRGILDAAHELNVEDPSIARFQGTARVDRERYPDLRKAIPNPPGEGAGLMGRLIGDGIETREIDPDRRREAEAVVRVMFVGLVASVSSDPEVHRLAIDGLKALLDGHLIRGPGPAPRPG